MIEGLLETGDTSISLVSEPLIKVANDLFKGPSPFANKGRLRAGFFSISSSSTNSYKLSCLVESGASLFADF